MMAYSHSYGLSFKKLFIGVNLKSLEKSMPNISDWFVRLVWPINQYRKARRLVAFLGPLLTNNIAERMTASNKLRFWFKLSQFQSKLRLKQISGSGSKNLGNQMLNQNSTNKNTSRHFDSLFPNCYTLASTVTRCFKSRWLQSFKQMHNV